MEHHSRLSNRPERWLAERRLDQLCSAVDILLGGKATKAQANRLAGGLGVMPQREKHMGRGVFGRVAGGGGRKRQTMAQGRRTEIAVAKCQAQGMRDPLGCASVDTQPGNISQLLTQA